MNLGELHRLFDPFASLEADDHRFVDLDPYMGDHLTLAAIANAIEVADTTNGQFSLQVVAGLPGTGKTTLLKRLQAVVSARLATPTLVIHSDISKRFKASVVVRPGELMAWILVELQRAADPQPPATLHPDVAAFFGAIPGAPSIAEWTLDRVEWSLQPKGLLSERLIALSDSPDLRELLLPAFYRAVGALVSELREQRCVEQLVFVLDGLEKLGLDETVWLGDARSAHKHAELLFSLWIPALNLPCHLIVTAPPAVLVAIQLDDYSGRHFIPMVKVREIDRRVIPAAIDLLITVIRKRHPLAHQTLFAPGSSKDRELVEITGGFLRDMFRLIQQTIRSYNTDRAFPIPDDTWDRAFRAHQDDIRDSVNIEDFFVLREIDRTTSMRHLRQFTWDQQRVLWRLLNKGVLLGYQNGERWYDLHPALEGDSRLNDELSLPNSGASRDGDDS